MPFGITTGVRGKGDAAVGSCVGGVEEVEVQWAYQQEYDANPAVVNAGLLIDEVQ